MITKVQNQHKGRPGPRLKVFYRRITSLLVEESVSVLVKEQEINAFEFFSVTNHVFFSTNLDIRLLETVILL